MQPNVSSAVTKLEPPKRSILGALAERYGMDPKAFEITIRAMAMPKEHTDEEFAACCLVAKEHNLNPFTREIYFMRTKSGTIQPIVGVDGWIRKCNEHPAFDGMNFEDSHDDKGKPVAIKCLIHRKDRQHPIVVTEYLTECQRPTDNWKQMPGRMLRHRALIQCARVAFGFAGIMDPDEFEQWQERFRGETARDITPAKAPTLALPDIPDELAKEPATPPPQADTAQGRKPDKKPDKTDADYLEELAASFAATRDMDSLNEVLVHNEMETEDRGLQQAVRDIYEKHRTRIYDQMT